MPTIPPPVNAEKPPEYLTGGHNVREIVVDDGIRDLAHSLAAYGFLQSVGAVDHVDHGEVLYGFRRLAAYRWGLGEGLTVPDKIPVRLYPPSLTATQTAGSLPQRRISSATDPRRPAEIPAVQGIAGAEPGVDCAMAWLPICTNTHRPSRNACRPTA